MESFWGTMQLELLDTKEWETRDELCQRHLRMDSPVTFETLHPGPDQDH
jgi:putative transposase